MASQFGAFVELESSSAKPIAGPPPPVVYADHHYAPTPLELDQLTFGTRYSGPIPPPLPPGPHDQSGFQTPKTPGELESHTPSPETASFPGSAAAAAAVDVSQSLNSPPRNKWRFLSACLVCVATGLNDSAPGALIPYIEAHYRINYGTVSLIFVTNALGFISAAPFTNGLHARLGRAWLLGLSMLLMTLAYIILVTTPPFPAVVVAFFFTGLGMAMALAVNNAFVAGLANASTLLGVFHGSYGVGGVLGPLIATAMVSAGATWSAFYGLTLGLSVLNALFAFYIYRGYEEESAAVTAAAVSAASPVELLPTAASQPSDNGNDRADSEGAAVNVSSSARKSSKRGLNPRKLSFLQTLKSRSTLLGAFFIFAYQGAEVSISGWVLSFLLATRPHPPSQSSSLGYVTSGFWLGITVGRFALSHPAHRVGEKRAVFGLVAGAAAFQLLVWRLPSIVGEAVAVGLVGLLLGPVYPSATVVFSRLLPREELVPSLAVISAMGSSGGAVAPFVTGLVSQKVGTWVLNPVAIGLFACMAACWAGLPRIGKRRD